MNYCKIFHHLTSLIIKKVEDSIAMINYLIIIKICLLYIYIYRSICENAVPEWWSKYLFNNELNTF